jgi:hypothetical protein
VEIVTISKERTVFSGPINRAKAALSHLVLKYVARASVAIPFLIALGFALAAIAVMLVERFGHVTAYWIMAGGLAAIGVVAAIAVSVKEHDEEVAEQKAERTETADLASDATQAIMQAPLALLGALASAPGGATSVFKIARILARNFPLVLLLAMIAVLIWPTENAEERAPLPEGEGKPNGFRPAETHH